MPGVAICLLAISGLAAAEREPGLRELVAGAEAAFRAGNPQQAVERFEAAHALAPSNPELLFALSRSYEELGRLDRAILAAERVQQLGYVSRARLDYRLARLHARSGHLDETLAWLRRSLDHRYENRSAIADDPSFAALREDPRFLEIAGSLPAAGLSRDEGWRFDLDYLVDEARRLHVGPERPAFSKTFAEQARTLHEAIPELTDDQVLARMMRLVALLGDGHSSLYGPGSDATLPFNRKRLPYRFYWFPDGLYVIEGVGDWKRHEGYRVVRFGGLEAGDVLQRMSAYRGVDNAMTWKWMGPQFYLGRLAMLKEVGATASDESVQLTLAAPDGRVVTETVPGGDHDLRRKLRPFRDVKPPLFLSRVGTNFWMQPLPAARALYFQFNQVRNAPDETLAEFAERLRQALTEDVDTLVVDVRHNNGGNNSLVTPLVRVLVAFEVADPGHRIVVLTGRNTFSAAQNFINRLERWTDAEFAGEPSSSSPNFVGEETDLRLPFSGVRGSISTRYWQDSDPGDERPWIAMDIPVELTARDYFVGRDPVLEAVLTPITGSSTPD